MSIDSSYPLLPLLLIDDEPNWLHSLSLSLKVSAGINNVISCTDSREVMDLLRLNRCSLVLLDLNMPYLGGEELLSAIKENYPELPVVIISGMNQIDTAIRCVKSGAEDFYVKTDERQRVVTGVLRVLKQQQLELENSLLAASLLQREEEVHPAFSAITTCSDKMRAIFSYVMAIAKSSEPVLIVGESGTGKELIAQALHKYSCPDSPWVAVNAAGLDDMVFSDTLFGHVKGAYTGAAHDRKGMVEKSGDGVLFLDEIGDLSVASQIKLLRLLQEGEYFPLGSDQPRKSKARILTATNADLQSKASAGAFRRDLHYRLCSHHIEVPPLRERKEDIGALVEKFLYEAASTMGKTLTGTHPELITLLSMYSFPGNVRELRSMIYDAVSVNSGDVLSLDKFKAAIGEDNFIADVVSLPASQSGVKVEFGQELPSLKDVGGLLVGEAIKRARGNQSLAAKMLGVTPQALSKRLKRS